MSIHTAIPTNAMPVPGYGVTGPEEAAIIDVPEPVDAPVVTEETCSALVKRADLSAAVNAVTRAAEKRCTIPVLANVLLRASGAGLVATCTDLDMEITAPVAGAADANFATTVPAHVLAGILKKAKASDMVAIDVSRCVSTWRDGRRQCENESAALDFDGIKFVLQGITPDDFPAMTYGATADSFKMATADLARAFGKTQSCISTEETRYYLNGVFIHRPQSSGNLIFVATDGHRLARVELPAPEGAMALPFTGGVICHANTVAEVLRMCRAKGAPETVTVAVTGGTRINPDNGEAEDVSPRLRFEVGGVTVLSKPIDGTFPDYGRVIPTGNDKELVIGAKAFSAAIEQVSIISSERGRAVKLSLERDRATFSVSNPDTGSSTMDVACSYGGDPLDIGFNSVYMRDILAQLSSENAVLALADAGSPMLIKGRDPADDGLAFVIMPMRV